MRPVPKAAEHENKNERLRLQDVEKQRASKTNGHAELSGFRQPLPTQASPTKRKWQGQARVLQRCIARCCSSTIASMSAMDSLHHRTWCSLRRRQESARRCHGCQASPARALKALEAHRRLRTLAALEPLKHSGALARLGPNAAIASHGPAPNPLRGSAPPPTPRSHAPLRLPAASDPPGASPLGTSRRVAHAFGLWPQACAPPSPDPDCPTAQAGTPRNLIERCNVCVPRRKRSWPVVPPRPPREVCMHRHYVCPR